MVEAAEASLDIAGVRSAGAGLLGERLSYFPVRHHSPACALQLGRLIRERRPTHVLIEGPASFDRFVDLLCNPGTVPPVAIYSFCTEAGESGPQRRAAHYPFCEYSPEWVALREGRAAGAEVRFIDLDFPQQLCVDQSKRLSERMATLLEERHFERSAYLRALARQRGCRDHDELWDRLFEIWSQRIPREKFVAQVLTYCALSRRDVSDIEHERDGTLARETEMAWHIRRVLDSRPRPGHVIVVTGGYHAVTLPALVAAGVERGKIDTGRIREAGAAMIRYSFERLDRLRGYGAGMPAPAFYQKVWEHAQRGPSDAPDLALEMIAGVAERARDSQFDHAPTAAGLIAAYEQVQRLAKLRNNPSPTRDDVCDALQSCFVKGAIDAEGRVLMRLAREVMTGSAIGAVPPEAGQPPIVADFFSKARRLRLKVDDAQVRKLSLDIYREPRDCEVSRFLHVLQLLDVPFAARLAGPQLTAPVLGRRLLELWEYSWSPQTESALIDAAVHGSSIEEAASNRFLEVLRQVSEDGASRSAALAVEWLSRACLLGLHAVAAQILKWLRTCVREDPALSSASAAISGLLLLWESRDPLGAAGLDAVPELARTCFERAVYLINEVHACAEAEAASAARALVGVRTCLTGTRAEWFDAELFTAAVGRLAAQQPCQPIVSGAAAGILYSTGMWSEEDLAGALAGQFWGRRDARATTAYFRGLLLASRAVLWRSPQLLVILREVVESASEPEFLRLLPELRLALSMLTPRESDQLGMKVAAALDVKTLGPAIEYSVTELEVRRNLAVSQRLREVLVRDGLGHWAGD